MKRIVIYIFFISILCHTIMAQEAVSIDTAIKNSVEYFAGRLPAGSRVIVLNITTSHSELSNYIINEMTMQLFNDGRLTMVSRQNLEAIRQEMNFQYSGYVSDESMVSIGRILGASTIISGNISPLGSMYRLQVQAIAVETIAIQGMYSVDIDNDNRLSALTGIVYKPSREEIRERARREREEENNKKSANSSNNWMTFDPFITGPGVGLLINYERMLGSKISLGISGYGFFNFIWPSSYGGMASLNYGIEIPFRFYPSGKTFYLETAFGFAGCLVIYKLDEDDPEYKEGSYSDNERRKLISGLSIAPGIGWKIDVGKAGGFYIQPGISGIIFLGENRDGNFGLVTVFPRINFAMGFSF